jgi:hypothetical protein
MSLAGQQGLSGQKILEEEFLLCLSKKNIKKNNNLYKKFLLVPF